MSLERLFVSIRELLITPNITLSVDEAQTLAEHCAYLSSVRQKLKRPISISRNSGYRPRDYEISKGRSGGSEHSTFDRPGRGAVDLIYYPELLEELLKDSFYTRICYYPNNGFIHADRKPVTDNKRQYFEADSPTSSWKFIRNL
jgi:hypothetical protein